MIRKATMQDVPRIAEIIVFGKRVAYRPIFNNDVVSFNELQVINVIEEYRNNPTLVDNMLVYDDGMYSFVQTVDLAPTYMIVNSMQLLEKIDGKVSDPLGTFKEITLNKDNFDSRFKGNIDYSWLGNETLESLKDNNKRIWQLYGDANAETPRLYILLEQKDGTFYLGHGYYNFNSVSPVNPDDSHIRWLYKLNEVYSFEDIDEAVSKAIIDDNYSGY